MIRDIGKLLVEIKRIHCAIRDAVFKACEDTTVDEAAAIAGDDAGDTIFAIDRVSEAILVELFEQLARHWPCMLIAEGLGQTGRVLLPEGISESEAEIRIIVDPIDGTRGLMYQKRPGWVLTGVAPNRGEETSLADIELAVQTEIPLLKQHLSDVLWAIKGQRVEGERYNRISGESAPITLTPSRARGIEQGFGCLARFFPGLREELAAIDDELVRRILGPVKKGRAQTFEDQYISSGGQLYEVLMGHDRWVADIRPLMEPLLARRGTALGLCAHPYDLSAELIARQAGVIVINEKGEPLDCPLDVETDVTWLAFANPALHKLLWPVLKDILGERSIL